MPSGISAATNAWVCGVAAGLSRPLPDAHPLHPTRGKISVRKFLGTLALSSAIALLVAPIAHAESSDGDANVAVFKVSHIDGSVIAAYDCTQGDTATIEVKVAYANGPEHSGKTENLKCSGKPTFTTIETDLGPGTHGNKVNSKISIKATPPEGSLDSDLVVNGSSSMNPADGSPG
ncbi:hypothetical protein ACIBCN_31940 [Nocardia sp. NPDC051052]|uniref:hypothetical protein n=1 Tax=Nocardia sp. NPDC051052 TaxID=3364322 RepID=UPI0037AFA6F5